MPLRRPTAPESSARRGFIHQPPSAGSRGPKSKLTPTPRHPSDRQRQRRGECGAPTPIPCRLPAGCSATIARPGFKPLRSPKGDASRGFFKIPNGASTLSLQAKTSVDPRAVSQQRSRLPPRRSRLLIQVSSGDNSPRSADQAKQFRINCGRFRLLH